jgi:hypothetical protein
MWAKRAGATFSMLVESGREDAAMAASTASRESRRMRWEKTCTFDAPVLDAGVNWGSEGQGEEHIGVFHLHLLQQIFGLRVNETFHLLIVRKVFFDATMLMKLEALLIEVVVRLSASDIVNLNWMFVKLATK